MANYIYIKSEPNLYTVGFYRPDGEFEPETDHFPAEEAAKRVAWLNGGQHASEVEKLKEQVETLQAIIQIAALASAQIDQTARLLEDGQEEKEAVEAES